MEGLPLISDNNTDDVQTENSAAGLVAQAIVNVGEVSEKESRNLGVGYVDDPYLVGPGEGNDNKHGKTGGKLEATGPGAAGILSGATVGTLAGAMRILAWNYRGLGRPRTVQELVRLVRTHCPKLVFISEAHQQKFFMESICWRIGLRNCLPIAVKGKDGGLVLYWDDSFTADLISFGTH
jgi:hypothetical protein